jgi:uncharacterized protein YjbI with pentapeptide repeats
MMTPRLNLRRPENLEQITGGEFVRQAAAEGRFFDFPEFMNVRLRDASIVECVIEGMTLADSDFTGLRVIESSIERLVAPRLGCSRSAWRDVSIAGSRLGAAELHDSEWSGVHVSDSKLDLINFRGAQLSDVLLERCQIDELDLTGAAATRVEFRDCTIQTLVLTAAQLTDVDVRGADLHHVTGLQNLRGATVSSVQLDALAPHMAAYLGIVVGDRPAHD